jgi:hypothetical protein
MKEQLNEIIINKNINDFIQNRKHINKSNFADLIEQTLISDSEEIFDYLLDLEGFDVAYDDSVLFNYSVELQKLSFSKKIAEHKDIDILNDNCHALILSLNNENTKAVDFLLSFKEILNYINKEWIEEHIYEDTTIFEEKLQILKNVEDF